MTSNNNLNVEKNKAEVSKNVPELRFQGFIDAWELHKLGDVANFFDEKRVPIDSRKRISGKYPYYGATGIIDYVDDYIFDGEYVLLAEDGANITMRNSPVAYITTGKFWLNNHAHILKMIDGSNNFLLQILENQNYEKFNSGTAQPKLNGKVVKGLHFYFPSSEEQQNVGLLFKQLDDTITLHQRKLDKLKQLKQGYLQQMFLKNDEKVPRVRFANFDDEWGQRKAKDIFKPRIEKGKPELPVLSVTQYNGVVYRDNVGINIKYDKNTLINYKVIHKNDFVISLRSFQGGFELSDKLGISSPAYTIFIPQDSKSHDSLFWKNQFKTYKFIESLKSVTFGIRDGKSISFSEFGTLKLRFPNQKHEQKLVGLLFEKLNHTIVLHQSKIEKLKLLKQVLLQKMFI